MNLERWSQIKQVFAAVLDAEPPRRHAVMEELCGADAELRAEVESLLSSHDEAGDFIESPAVAQENVGELLSRPAHLQNGSRLGAYRIEREISHGGMGAVYLAVRADQEFQRRVAIKVIRPGMATDGLIRRFRTERQILADLDHPNIARLLDGGRTEDGLPYLVMEHIEGERIDRWCDAKQLPLNDRLALFRQVCAAVEYAHRKQVVHRDLKPGNILVTADGVPKLLDFGIAKLLEPSAHGSGHTTGDLRLMTPDYASPEQVLGDPITPASDIYSLGLLLYELLTGHRPLRFGARAALATTDPISGRVEKPSQVIEQVQVIQGGNRAPVEITPDLVCRARSTTLEELSRQLSGPLDSIVLTAMQTDPRKRYATAAEFAADIQRHLQGEAISALAINTDPTPETQVMPELGGAPSTLAVLPFQVLGTDSGPEAYLGLGVADALITKLSNVRRIVVRPTASVLTYKGRGQNLVAVGRALQVRYVLDGHVRRQGNRVRLTVQLVNCREGRAVWAAKFDEDFTELLHLEDLLSTQVVQAVVPHLTGEERESLHHHSTNNPEAYQNYLKGRYHWSRHTTDDIAQALICFTQAIAADPQYALAHAGLADYHTWLSIWGVLPPRECFAAAKSAATRALEIDPSLVEARTSLALAQWADDHHWLAAEQSLREARESHPGFAAAHHWYALLLGAQGRQTEACEAMDHARELDPLSPLMASSSGWLRFAGRQFDRALIELDTESTSAASNSSLLQGRSWVYSYKGQHPEAIAAATQALESDRGNPSALAALACAQARAGKTVEARATLLQLEAASTERYVPRHYFALVHAAVGDLDQAIQWLQQACDARDFGTLWLKVDPRLDALRSHPRFPRLLAAIGLGEPVPSSAPTVVARPAPAPAPPPPVRRAVPIWAIAALLVVTAAIGYYFLRGRNGVAFESTRIGKLTTSGDTTTSAISPDGKYVAYSMREREGQSVWVRQASISGSVRILPARPRRLRGLTFSPDGNYILYLATEGNNFDHGSVWQVPALGGIERLLIRDARGPVAISLDGRRLAFIRTDAARGEDALIVAAGDGSAERKVLVRRHPDRFVWSSGPAWSPDGETIAVALENTDRQGQYLSMALIDAANGTIRRTLPQRWQYLEHMTWLPDGTGILAIGHEARASFQQIWLVPVNGSPVRRLTNDLSDYSGLSITADSHSLVTTQTQMLTSISLAPNGDFRRAQQLTPATGRYFDLCWGPNNKLYFASDASGSADVYVMDPDGANARQLTSGGSRNYSPATTRSSPHVVFHSNRSGTWNIWRMALDGGSPFQLTVDVKDSNWPQITPDGKTVVYHHLDTDAQQHLWQVPIDGGPASRLTEDYAQNPSIQWRDGRIACWYRKAGSNASWQIAILPPNGGAPLQTFTVPPTVSIHGVMHWAPDGKSLHYIDNAGNRGNLWNLPLDGSPATPMTTFTSGILFSFDWSPEGHLAFSRGYVSSDVVMISDQK